MEVGEHLRKASLVNAETSMGGAQPDSLREECNHLCETTPFYSFNACQLFIQYFLSMHLSEYL